MMKMRWERQYTKQVWDNYKTLFSYPLSLKHLKNIQSRCQGGSGYMDTGEERTGDLNLLVLNMYMIFKALRLRIRKGMRTEK